MQLFFSKRIFARKLILLLSVVFLFPLSYLAADFTETGTSAVTESLPSAIVAGAVNAITGDHYIVQNDIVIEGAVPLRMPRSYISGAQSTLYKGWQLFHHIYAASDKGEDSYDRKLFLTIIEPNGTYLHFQKCGKDKKDKTILFTLSDLSTDSGLTNAARGDPSGKTNLKNYQIWMDKDKESFQTHCPDGTIRYYRYMKGSTKEYSSTKDLWAHELFASGAENCLYRLERETLPNKTGISYEYDDHHRLKKVATTNHDGSKIYVSATFHYHSEKFHKNRDVDIHTSDGKILRYHYEYRDRSFLLKSVASPAFPNETMKYKHIKDRQAIRENDLLRYRTVGLDRYYELDYYAPGDNDVGDVKLLLKSGDPRIFRVKTLKAPVGDDTTAHITHRFFYFPKKNLTQVREIDNTLTEYYYSNSLRLEKIKRYGPGDALRNTEQFVWGVNKTARSQLLCHTIFDASDTPISSHRYFYDDLGNVHEERLYEKNSGEECPPLTLDSEGLPIDNGTETYTIRRQFSQDGLHLLLKEEEPSGKITTCSYLNSTSLIASKYVSEGQEIKIRTFYHYDKDFVLTEETVDDGHSTDKNDLSGVTTKKTRKTTPIPDGQPYQGMPFSFQDSYWDGTQEVLLKKVLLSYENGKITKQDIYDAQDHYRYSLTMKYDSAGRLKEATNALGQVATYDYDSVGNLILSQDASGKLLTKMHYDSSNRLSQIEEIGIDGHQKTTRYHYDKKHHKIATTDPYGHTTKYVIDSFGNETERHHPSIYDSEGHPLSATTLHSYDNLGSPLSTTEPNGDCTLFTYNTKNQPLIIQHPNHTSEQFFYNPEGTLSRHVNQAGATTNYRYDFLGRITAKTNPLGATTTYQYNAFNLLSVTDPEDNVTTYEYDGAGRKTAESLGQQRISFTYDSLGRLHSTHAGDLCTIQEYDDLDRVIEERAEDLSGKLFTKVRYGYDAAGNRDSVIRYIHNQETQESLIYDSFNRLIAHIDPLGHITTTGYNDQFINPYEQRVLQTTETDPLGLKTLTTYDVLGHISTIEKKNPQDELLTLEENFYNSSGLHTHHMKDHRPVAVWMYGPMHRLSALIEGGTRTTQFTYLPTGELHQRIKPSGVVLENHYDLLGQLIHIQSSDATIHYTFSYNKIGQQIEAKDELAQKTTLRAYDSQGHLTQETLANGLTLRSDYDEQGRKKHLHLPNSSTIVYTYDALHLKQIAYQGLTHYFHSYDLNGNLLEEERIGALGKITYTYDPLGRKQSSSSTAYTQQCTLDPLSNVTTLRTNGKLDTFAYDDLYQLTSEQGHQYAYDALGNRLSKDTKASSYDPLNQILAKNLTYDTQGNLSRDYPYSYIYDAFDRLAGINTLSGCIHFYYDAFGRMISKEVNGTETLYLYDGNKEIGTADTSGKILQLRVLNPNLPAERGAAVLLHIDNQTYCPVHDLFGNVRQLLDLQGHLVESYNYSAFGEGTTTGINPWRYASKRSHAGTSLIFFGKRFYDPEKGRWLTPDPAGFIDGDNLYLFVCNNPLAKMDLFGLRAETIFNLFNEGKMEIVQFDPIRNLDHQPPREIAYSTFAFERDYPDYGTSFFDVFQHPRVQGSFQAVGGLVEAGVGAGLTFASYGMAAPLGFAIMGHGLDHFTAGMSTLITGNPSNTLTSQLLQSTGMSREIASLIDSGISIVGSGGGAAAIRGSQCGAAAFQVPTASKEGLFQTPQCNVRLWPSPSKQNQCINNLEYVPHALERMSPRGLIHKGTEMVSRGVPPSVVENTIKFGVKSQGNTTNEIIHTFENVRVVTNVERTRVITVITTGR